MEAAVDVRSLAAASAASFTASGGRKVFGCNDLAASAASAASQREREDAAGTAVGAAETSSGIE